MIVVPRRAPIRPRPRRIVRPRLAGGRRNGLLLASAGAAAPGLDPDEVTDAASLWAWLYAPDIALADGTAVDTWSDRSAAGHDYTQAGSKRPTYKTAIQNGLDIVRFDGTDDGMANSVGPNLNDRSLVAVFSIAATPPAQAQVVFSVNLSGGFFSFVGRKSASPNDIIINNDGTAFASGDTLPADGSFHCVIFYYNPGLAGTLPQRRAKAWLDGVEIMDLSATSSTPFATRTGLGFINTLTESSWLKGDIAELAFYHNSIVPADLLAVSDRFMDRWGI